MRSGTFWLTLPIALLIAAPWYVYAAQQAGGTLIGQFFWYEIGSRIAGTPHGHGGPPGYHLLVGLVGWLPWTALVPGAVIEAWQGRRHDRVAGLLLVWAGLPWLVLELIHSKLPHYVLPCYVPLAILLGRMWATGLDRPTTRLQRAVLGVWAAAPLLLGAALLTAGLVAHNQTWSVVIAVAGTPLLAGFAIVGWLVWRGRFRAAWVAAVGVAILFHAVFGLGVLPALEPYRLSRLVAERANAVSEPTGEVLACGYDEPSLFFYLECPGRVVPSDALRDALRPADRPRVVIARDASLHAAGLNPQPEAGLWVRVRGFNYVKGRDETVWVVRVPAGAPPLWSGGPKSASETLPTGGRCTGAMPTRTAVGMAPTPSLLWTAGAGPSRYGRYVPASWCGTGQRPVHGRCVRWAHRPPPWACRPRPPVASDLRVRRRLAKPRAQAGVAPANGR